MTTEHRKAPRRAVKEIRKTGRWGQYAYHHVLECGHIEVRPRASSTKKLACVWCLRSEGVEKEMTALLTPPKRNNFTSDEDLANIESYVASVKATIASRLGVDMEAVDVVVKDVQGDLEIKHATVFLSARDVRKIAGQTDGGI
jgi:hypothetical protein